MILIQNNIISPIIGKFGIACEINSGQGKLCLPKWNYFPDIEVTQTHTHHSFVHIQDCANFPITMHCIIMYCMYRYTVHIRSDRTRGYRGLTITRSCHNAVYTPVDSEDQQNHKYCITISRTVVRIHVYCYGTNTLSHV